MYCYIYELQLISCVMEVIWKLKFIQLTVTTHRVLWKGKVCLCNCASISKTALALLGSQGQKYPQTSPSDWWGRRWWLWLSGISHIVTYLPTSSTLEAQNWNKEAQNWNKYRNELWFDTQLTALRNEENTMAEQHWGNSFSRTQYCRSVTNQWTPTSRAVPRPALNLLSLPVLWVCVRVIIKVLPS